LAGLGLSAAVILGGAHTVSAQTVTKTTRDTLDISFDPGTGNPNTDFAITEIVEGNGNEIEIGVKGKQRFVGQENVGGTGTVYEVQPGFSRSSPTDPSPDTDRAWWNWDFSVDLGDRSTEGDTEVTMDITDPEGDSYSLSEWGNTDLIQSSWNIGFGFINDAMFDTDGDGMEEQLGTGGLGGFKPNLTGDYTIDFSVSDASAGELGSQQITARVVPLPGSAWAGLSLLGVLGGSAAVRRWKVARRASD